MKFYDSLVSGLKYVTQSGFEGFTTDGTLECIPGETVEFFLGSLQIGSSVICSDQKRVLPTDLFNNSEISSAQVINTGVLLQSLDTDGNASNGINLPPGVAPMELPNIDLSDDTDSDNDDIPDIAESFLGEITDQAPTIVITSITKTAASNHFKKSFGTNGVYEETLMTTTQRQADACPTAFTLKIENDLMEFDITSGIHPLNLANFDKTISTRNLESNSIKIEFVSNTVLIRSSVCEGIGVQFSYSVIDIDASAVYDEAGSSTTGSYTYKEYCNNNAEILFCAGNW